MWRHEHLVAGLLLLICLSSCSTIREYGIVSAPWQDQASLEYPSIERSCDSIAYQEYVAPRTVVLRFHILNILDSTANFTPIRAATFIDELLNAANHRMRHNDKMKLPVHNETPVYHTQIQYVLSDQPIVYHYLENPFFIKSGYKSNRYDRSQIARLSEGDDNMIHVFLMPFDPKEIRSKRQKRETTGIALGNKIKIAGYYELGGPGWNHAGVFNHEVGHVLGLQHTWNEDDQCSDTPQHANCWDAQTSPPCDGVTSNNMMDYNAHQSAITPCQIIRMHQTMNEPFTVAAKVSRIAPCLEPSSDIIILEHDHIWQQTVLIKSDVIIKEGVTLYIDAQVTFANDVEIYVEKKAKVVWISGELKANCQGKLPSIIAHRKSKFIKKGTLSH